MAVGEDGLDEDPHQGTEQAQAGFNGDDVGDPGAAGLGHHPPHMAPAPLQPGGRRLVEALPWVDLHQPEGVAVERDHAEEQEPTPERDPIQGRLLGVLGAAGGE